MTCNGLPGSPPCACVLLYSTATGFWKAWRLWYSSCWLRQKLCHVHCRGCGKYMIFSSFLAKKKVPEIGWRRVRPCPYCWGGLLWKLGVSCMYRVTCWYFPPARLPRRGITYGAAGWVDMPVGWKTLGSLVQASRGEWKNFQNGKGYLTSSWWPFTSDLCLLSFHWLRKGPQIKWVSEKKQLKLSQSTHESDILIQTNCKHQLCL